ncbi:hypothetical protein niasHT_038646 [Heterodera trifolii]|uniref:Uncharacterized protein n=1 Tax=Heterodera trifolii TaxID=157864 RepID=A0ABD2HRD9_9BILA
MPPMEKETPADEYDGSMPSSIAMFNVYGWLPADKQPKKLADIKAAPPPPPANYDIKRVASEAAESVYSWLPIEQQPKMMDTSAVLKIMD